MKREAQSLNYNSYHMNKKTFFNDNEFFENYEKITPVRTKELYGVVPYLGVWITTEYKLLKERDE